MTTPTRSSDGAITLAEAAKQLRDRADFLVNGGDTTLVPHYRALATLLDGDGDGGLLGEHEHRIDELRRSEIAVSQPDRTGGDTWYITAQVGYAVSKRYLTFVAAYVSAVLGQEVAA